MAARVHITDMTVRSDEHLLFHQKPNFSINQNPLWRLYRPATPSGNASSNSNDLVRHSPSFTSRRFGDLGADHLFQFPLWARHNGSIYMTRVCVPRGLLLHIRAWRRVCYVYNFHERCGGGRPIHVVGFFVAPQCIQICRKEEGLQADNRVGLN